MFKIYDGRTHFYQWDLDRKLIVEDPSITEVHFCNRTDECSLVCETFIEDGLTLVNVPNILFQTNWRIHVYAYDGSYTKHDACFEVKARTKPTDYVYTETEIKTWERLEEELNEKADTLIAEGIEEVQAQVVEQIKDYTNNIFANALTGSATGETVSLKDVSPVEHNIGVRVSSKNLFDGVWESGIISGTNGANVAVDGYTRAKNYIPVVYGEKYVFSNGFDNSVSILIYEYTEGFTYNLTNNIVLHPNSVYTPSKATTKFIRFRFNAKAFPLDTTAQLEKGTSATAYTPYIADIAAVKVKAQGKNLFDYTQKPYSNIDNTMSLIDNGFEFVSKGTNVYPAVYFRVYDKAFFNTKLAINLKAELPSCIEYLDFSVKVNGTDQIAGGTTFPYVMYKTVPEYHEGDFLQLQFVARNPNKEAGAVIRVTDIQVERETPTEVEPYKEPIEYAQGEAIKSIYPTTVLTTDTEGALVEAEYSKDINKAFAALTQAIISLGGNI